jgi:nucleoid DNA-binding protein
MVNVVFDSMTEALAKGERIEIRGFGSFLVKQRLAGNGRNPRTGAMVAVAAKRIPQFKVGKELRFRVDGQLVDVIIEHGEPRCASMASAWWRTGTRETA